MSITLRAARVNAGMTQDEVARQLRKNKQTIVNWENGKTPIDEGNFIALCVMYGIKKEYIFLPEVSA